MTNSAKRKSRAISLGLAESLNMVEQIHRQGGGAPVPKDSLEHIIVSKPTSSLFQRKLAALRAYGLIETQEDMVFLTPLGEAYATPTSPEQKSQIALQAFRKIPLFEKLINQYSGKPLPEINHFFYNLLASTYNIPNEEAPKWIKEFVEGARLVGILVSEGGHEVVRLPGSVSAPSIHYTEGAPTMEANEFQDQSGEVVSLVIHGAKTQMNFPDKIDEKMLQEAIGATEDYLELLKRKLSRLTGKEYEPKMTVYVPKNQQH